MPPRENSPYHLLVEGTDDKHSLIALMMRHGVDWDAQARHLPFVSHAGSVDELLKSLPVAAKSYRRFGAVLDADTAPDHRWAQVRGRLASVGLTLPEAPDPDGMVTAGFLPDSRLGVWLMPDNASPGALESFLRQLVPAGDAVWPHAGAATDGAVQLGAPVKDRRKGELYAWLAWQEPPGMPFGTALTAKVLGHDSPDALRFVSWFRRLFLE